MHISFQLMIIDQICRSFNIYVFMEIRYFKSTLKGILYVHTNDAKSHQTYPLAKGDQHHSCVHISTIMLISYYPKSSNDQSFVHHY